MYLKENQRPFQILSLKKKKKPRLNKGTQENGILMKEKASNIGMKQFYFIVFYVTKIYR
jgi:hypothetical protein